MKLDGVRIEYQGLVAVVRYPNGTMRPASDVELHLWDRLTRARSVSTPRQRGQKAVATMRARNPGEIDERLKRARAFKNGGYAEPDIDFDTALQTILGPPPKKKKPPTKRRRLRVA